VKGKTRNNTGGKSTGRNPEKSIKKKILKEKERKGELLIKCIVVQEGKYGRKQGGWA